MSDVFLKGIRIDYNVVKINIHETTNILGEQMVHQRLVSSRSVAIPNLDDQADHIAIRCGHCCAVNMRRIDPNLLVSSFLIKGTAEWMSRSSPQHPFHVW